MNLTTSANKANYLLRQPLVDALQMSLCQQQSQLQGKRIWLACSGGRDSLSLAIICQQLYAAGQLPFLPQLLHVNHGMQASSDGWAEQVQTWAQQHDMPCQILQVKVDGHSEQAARDARYAAMMALMNQGDVLMLAHHSDDQAETVLMRLFNGAGVTGLAGMQAWTKKQLPQSESEHTPATSGFALATPKHIYLWRPWLQISRQQITDYAKSSGLAYIDDPTNVIEPVTGQQPEKQTGQQAEQLDQAKPANDRAWLRSVLLPQIRHRYPQASEAIARSSQLLHDASVIVNEQANMDRQAVSITDQVTHNVNKPDATQITEHINELSGLYSVLSIERLGSLSVPRQSAVIHAWLSPHPLDLPASKRLVDQVLSLCQRQNPDHQTCIQWHSGQHHYQIRRYQQQLYRLRIEIFHFLNFFFGTFTRNY